ncbi:MAG: response regulator transcription factor [Phycisphaerae bacterium]
MPQAAKKRVVVVEDHPVARSAIVRLINQEPGLEVAGNADDTAVALRIIARRLPDVVTMDIRLKDSGGIELIREITVRWPELPVIVFSMHDEVAYAQRVLDAGGRGYVSKGERPEKLLEGIERVIRGEIFVSDHVGAKLLDGVAGGAK